MDAKDLMIGDWYKYSVGDKDYFFQVTAEDFTKDCVANFEPVPITPEILEKNGWRYDDLCYEWHSDCNAMTLYGNDCSMLAIFDGVTVCYIHELQHAVHLYGLKDMAINFKLL